MAEKTAATCQAGHLLDDANLYRKKDGSRRCRACVRVRTRNQRLEPITADVLNERFWNKVDKSESETDCWDWIAGTQRGYGRFTWNGTVYKAHRFIYEATHGPIPDGLVLDHLCRNRSCVNLAHLELVTPGENTVRGLGAAARGLCSRGHRFDAANTGTRRNGRHFCIQCLNASEQTRLERLERHRERLSRLGVAQVRVRHQAIRLTVQQLDQLFAVISRSHADALGVDLEG